MLKNGSPRLEAKVRVCHVKSEKGPELLGFAELVIDGAFVIKEIKVLKGKNGTGEPFVAFPSRRGTGENQDKWFDVAHPITLEAREAARDAVLAAYRQAAAGR